MKKTDILAAFEKHKVLAIIRLHDSDDVIPVGEALVKGGIKMIELTLTTPKALEKIEELCSMYEEKKAKTDVLIGAGSVLSAQDVKRAVKAGARFVVSPIFKKEIIEEAHKRDVVVICGAFTPTEILRASEAGSDIVKVFPAEIISPVYVQSVLAPMPHLRMMPTGGITLANVGDWLQAGAVAVGVGGALLDSTAIAARQFDVITKRAEKFVAYLQSRA
ncbi:MAG: bifunctional 4-hydroxy-2-oxoglutarate aldolase/2-dehydro-3-deoxy-phosphogluconate aldolase [Candidatus Kapaibacterium sp.]|nr:MAG: bifunctional 4-hydroxy-2-oxoglutarate aldolase/2-dehydro-3-deoxy-phosphogluconate aldolase [Candidatus Kapabacteria bacterium]